MCPRTGQETASQVRSFGPSWHVACTALMGIDCCSSNELLLIFYAAHCRSAGPVRAKYGSDSEFFDLDVSKFALFCLQSWLHFPTV